ncbi:MAG TPA: hypothetical protein PLZ62_02355 [bacterium]|nr:hypothetical protein [bacterium]
MKTRKMPPMMQPQQQRYSMLNPDDCFFWPLAIEGEVSEIKNKN